MLPKALQTYARLTHEVPVAQVSVRNLDPASARYLVTLAVYRVVITQSGFNTEPANAAARAANEARP
ncbi:MAG TPA: hypothetical protein VHX61_19675 [Rhizomicrobium sp.]|nr:hypothetical protein [Rhizomicrobium sp.]